MIPEVDGMPVEVSGRLSASAPAQGTIVLSTPHGRSAAPSANRLWLDPKAELR